MKPILIVSYHFPPASEVGGLRPTKFAQYLPAFGWDPYVLTVTPRPSQTHDATRLRNIDPGHVIRTGVWPMPLRLFVNLKHSLIRRFSSPTSECETLSKRVATQQNPDGGIVRGSRQIAMAKRLLNSIFELPDPEVGWLLPALVAGYRIIKMHRIQYILSTSPPTTPTLIALILSRLTRAHLIIDLRDPWNLHSAKPVEVRSALSDAIERWMEQRFMHSAHSVITTTTHYTEFLRRKYATIPQQQILTIPNGFDPSDYPLHSARPANEQCFVISYLGTFYLGRTPKNFLEAVGQLVAEQVIPKRQLRINLIGHVAHADGVPVADMSSRNGLLGCVTMRNPVPYAESLALMKDSDVLLLFAPNQYYAVPAKAYEYLGAKKPILCFGNRGATADLIREMGAGYVVADSDLEAIKVAVRDLYEAWRSNRSFCYTGDPSQYERHVLTRALVTRLEGTEYRASTQ